MAKGESDIFRKYHLADHLKGHVRGGIFVIWIESSHAVAPQKRLEAIVECVKEEMRVSNDILTVAHNAKEYHQAIENGKIGVIYGLEGLSYIESDLGLLEWLYEQGARHASLTWNEENALATGAKGTSTRGLTTLGKEAVKKMEKLKMLLDVSHLNEKTFWDVAKIQTLPMMASHSNARALCDHPRNLTDDQLKLIRDLGGVVGINSYPGFVSDKGDLASLVNHTEYLVEKIGIDHVGCGFDFCDYLKEDGVGDVLKNLEDTSKVPNLFSILREKGYEHDALEKIAHKNFERLLEIL
jgi:membrane dipeptidase